MNSKQQSSTLLPFRGVRFDPYLPGGLDAVIGPPADIESSDEARAFVRGRPFNAVRLEIEDADSTDALRFAHARNLYESWRRNAVLHAETDPSYYVYEQSFDHDGERCVRRGVFGLVPIDAPDVCILPHEETWEENRQRRLQILRDLDASISPIYLIYDGSGPDSEDRADRKTSIPTAILARAPDAEGTDEFGNGHRLWVVSNPDEVQRIGDMMQGRQFIIADGHHRFEAARIFHAERDAPETGLILACCVAADDPGIIIRPIHRIIPSRDSLDWASAMGDVSNWFEIQTEAVNGRTGTDLVRQLSSGELPEAGVITNGGMTFARLRLRSWDVAGEAEDDERPRDGATGRPDQVPLIQRLDVSVITSLLIQRALGISEEAEPEMITYSNDANDVLHSVSERGGIGILMRPIRLQQVMAIARAHGKVPAKSTSFVPKVPLGLVLHEF